MLPGLRSEDRGSRRRGSHSDSRTARLVQLLQVRQYLRGRLVAHLAVFRQCPVDDVFESWGNRGIDLPSRDGHLHEDGIMKLWPSVTPECLFPGSHFVEHQAKRKQIRARVQLLPARLLWRHIARCAHGHSSSTDRQIGSWELLNFV